MAAAAHLVVGHIATQANSRQEFAGGVVAAGLAVAHPAPVVAWANNTVAAAHLGPLAVARSGHFVALAAASAKGRQAAAAIA